MVLLSPAMPIGSSMWFGWADPRSAKITSVPMSGTDTPTVVNVDSRVDAESM